MKSFEYSTNDLSGPIRDLLGSAKYLTNCLQNHSKNRVEKCLENDDDITHKIVVDSLDSVCDIPPKLNAEVNRNTNYPDF